MLTGKIILAGGSGFLGRTLARWLVGRGCEAVILSRGEPNGQAAGVDGGQIQKTRFVQWDGERLGEWACELDGALALVNLAGRSVNCRYTPRNRKLMMDSRLHSTRVLGEAMRACKTPPKVWLQSSTATIYKHVFGTAGPAHDEHGEIGATPQAKDAFSIEVATAWEREFESASQGLAATRKVIMRTAIVLGTEPATNNAFRALRMLARLGLGGALAGGRQYVSWIHEVDFCRAIEWLIENPAASGIYNLAAPGPASNAEFMRAVRRACAQGTPGKVVGLPAAAWMLEVGAFFLRTESELLLKSRRVTPARLASESFEFKFPRLESALADLEGRVRA